MNDCNLFRPRWAAITSTLGVVIVVCAGWQSAEPRRKVRVEVTVHAPAGTPVASVAVSLATGKGAAVARTDANGKVTLVGTAEVTDTAVPIVLSPITAGGFYAERTQDIERYETVMGSHAFERGYPLQLVTGVEDYSITLIGKPSCKVAARILIGGQPANVDVIHANTALPLECPSGEVSMGGIPANQAGLAFVFPEGDDERVFVLEVPATSANEVAALGDVSFPALVSGQRIKIQMNGGAQLRATSAKLIERGSNITLISSTTGQAYGGAVTSDGTAWSPGRNENDSDMRVPLGTYYVCPGALDGVGLPTKLWKLIRAGRVADVEAASVPKIVVTAASDKAQSFTVDGVAAEAAITGIQ